MTSARQPEPTLTFGGEATDANDITRRNTGHDRPVDVDEKSAKAQDPLESDMSDLEPAKEFKEGGYGWYVSLENMPKRVIMIFGLLYTEHFLFLKDCCYDCLSHKHAHLGHE